MPNLHNFDWDFRAISDSEVMACCHYEFARESDTIIGYYDDGKKPNVLLGLTYCGEAQGKLLAFPNPFQWPWPVSSDIKFAMTPWQSLRPEYRQSVSNQYTERSPRSLGFVSADSPLMVHESISRGDSRSGINDMGRERIAVEIDWAGFDNTQIEAHFKEWIKANRPKNIGLKNMKGRGSLKDWRAKLKRIGIARLLSRCTLGQIPKDYPDAWEWLQTSGEWRTPFTTPEALYTNKQDREVYRASTDAVINFRELFPFLPLDEKPRFSVEEKK